MQHYWNGLIDQTINDRYVLGHFLGEHRGAGMFEVLSGAAAAPAVIYLLPEDASDLEQQQLSWELAAKHVHPNLVRVFESGNTSFDGADFHFAVTERPDETVAEVLPQRALTEEEVRQVLASMLPALRHLHDHGMVHGDIRPSSIVAIGDNVKLSSDSVAAADDAAVSSDVRGLGLTIAELLTAKRPFVSKDGRVDAQVMNSLPSRFQSIVAGLVDRTPGKQWGLWQVQRALAAETHVEPASAVRHTASTEVSFSTENLKVNGENQKSSSRTFVLVAAVVAAFIVFIAFRMMSRSSKPDPTPAAMTEVAKPSPIPQSSKNGRLEISPPPQQTPPAKTPTASTQRAASGERARAEVPPAAAPRQTPVQSGTDTSGEWAVVAAIYNDYDAAAARARNYENRMSSPVTVFPPKGEGRRYMILLGSGLTKAEAERLRSRARSAGLPSDTYVSKVDMNER